MADSMKTNPTTQPQPAAPLDPEVLRLLRCPATKEPLREITKPDGSRILQNISGTRDYAFVRGIAVLVATSNA
jgi:uncharacterized protein YbaR (Trm112 family)